jgi:gluconate 2-dehydrogenase gamma chain
MQRRDLLKAMALSPLTAGAFLTGADVQAETADKELEDLSQMPEKQVFEFANGRTPEELTRDAELMKQKFFSDTEMKTLSRLTDIIIPADEKSGSASQAKVPEFIEFMAKDTPRLQTPLRGGLRWLDVQANKRFGKNFIDCPENEQLTLIDLIAYPQKATSDMKAGVSFFNLLRNLTASGYFTSETGIKYLEYKGNTPNQWTGVPAEVLAKYGFA